MKTAEVFVKNIKYSISSKIVPISTVINGIKHSPSNNCTALPLRGGKGETLPDWADEQPSREINRKHNSDLRKIFLSELELSKVNALKGLYFFLKLLPKKPDYYYIGVSNNLARRIGDEHLKNKDFIFYSICFPNNRVKYLNEAIRFYASKPMSSDFKDEYIRESSCLEKVLFEYIAWVGCNDWPKKTWEEVETHFIANKDFYPCCNDSKKDALPSAHYLDEFECIKTVLHQLLLNSI